MLLLPLLLLRPRGVHPMACAAAASSSVPFGFQRSLLLLSLSLSLLRVLDLVQVPLTEIAELPTIYVPPEQRQV